MGEGASLKDAQVGVGVSIDPGAVVKGDGLANTPGVTDDEETAVVITGDVLDTPLGMQMQGSERASSSAATDECPRQKRTETTSTLLVSP